MSNALPKNNVNKVPRWVFRKWVTKLLISPVKIRIFCPEKVQIWPENGICVHCISQDTQDTYLRYMVDILVESETRCLVCTCTQPLFSPQKTVSSSALRLRTKLSQKRRRAYKGLFQFYQKTEASALLLLLLIVYFRFSGPPNVFQKEHFGQ